MSAITVTITREETKALILLSLSVLVASGVAALLTQIVSSWPFPYALFADFAIFALWIGTVILLWDEGRRRLGT